MKAILARFKEFCQSEGGPTTVEYAVMLALVVAVVMTVVAALGTKTNELFQEFNDEFEAATNQ